LPITRLARWHQRPVNNAGVSHFRFLENQPAEEIDLALAVNLQAPFHLCRLLLPHLQRQPEAHILNTGSVFGGIGYAAYSVYSATKFAIRGFSEALRRELADTAVQVHYLAPRATRTGINTAAVESMNAELGVAMDTPPVVARAACAMLEKGTLEAVVGWPKFFVRLDAGRDWWTALRKQLSSAAMLAQCSAATTETTSNRQDSRPARSPPSLPRWHWPSPPRWAPAPPWRTSTPTCSPSRPAGPTPTTRQRATPGKRPSTS
jgi:hypothetical protein